MKEAVGNLWTFPADWRVITTNGAWRRDGRAVMGRGCAREAAQRHPLLPWRLGQRLHREGNHVFCFPSFHLLTFPVKHHWSEQADVELIQRSVQELGLFIKNEQTYVMPRPGCGNGRLAWDVVRPLLLSLPENVTVITFEEERCN